MIVGRNPRTPVIGDTVLSRSDRRRDGRDTLRWHARHEITVPATRLRTAMAVTDLTAG
jgi:hypothetical protein